MERPAFDRLITAAFPQIQQAAQKYAILYRQLYEWEDIAQTALLKMLRFADQYDPGKGDLLPWACVIIINTIKTHAAQSMRAQDFGELNARIIGRMPTQDGYNPEEYAQMAFILSNLNKEARMYYEGYNYQEIAARCGFRSKVTAKNRIDRCADRLRRIMGGAFDQGRRITTYSKKQDN